MPARMSRVLSRNGRLAGGGRGTDPLDRFGAMDVTVAGIASDRLYPLDLQAELGRLLPGDRPVVVIESDYGHDGFLLETAQIASLLLTALKG